MSQQLSLSFSVQKQHCEAHSTGSAHPPKGGGQWPSYTAVKARSRLANDSDSRSVKTKLMTFTVIRNTSFDCRQVVQALYVSSFRLLFCVRLSVFVSVAFANKWCTEETPCGRKKKFCRMVPGFLGPRAYVSNLLRSQINRLTSPAPNTNGRPNYFLIFRFRNLTSG